MSSSPPPIAIDLPPLGLGAAALGNLYRPVSDETAMATVEAALACGRMGLIDTAPHYGQGLSERRVGMALKAYDGKHSLISTKVGRRLNPIDAPPPGTERHGFVDGDPFEPEFDYSYDGIMRAFESSLMRLKVDRVDVLLAHDLGEVTHGPDHAHHLKAFLDGGYKAMAQLRSDGLARAIGLGVNEWQICETVMAAADPDIFLLAGRYTLLEQGALTSFLPKCSARGLSVMLGGVYNSGILVTGTRGSGQLYYNYGPAPDAVVERVKRLEAICDAHGVPLAAAALQFPLAHEAVKTIVVGQASPQQVAATQSLFTTPIPSALWEDMRAEGLIAPDAPVPASPKVEDHV